MVMPPVEGESTEPHIEGESTPVPGDDDLDTLIDIEVDAVMSPEDIDRKMEELIAGTLEETYALASEASGLKICRCGDWRLLAFRFVMAVRCHIVLRMLVCSGEVRVTHGCVLAFAVY